MGVRDLGEGFLPTPHTDVEPILPFLAPASSLLSEISLASNAWTFADPEQGGSAACHRPCGWPSLPSAKCQSPVSAHALVCPVWARVQTSFGFRKMKSLSLFFVLPIV